MGSSGDLAPLSHIALALIGKGPVYYQGVIRNSGEVLRENKLNPLVLTQKEGLALINGTQVMTAVGALSLIRLKRLYYILNLTGAMSLEALGGTRVALDPRLHGSRPHRGQSLAARLLARLTADSMIISSHKDCPKVQDAYSLRCMPQVHGASYDAICYLEQVLTTELNSVTDNPLVFPPEGEDIPCGYDPAYFDDISQLSQPFCNGGNFHGQPVALALDFGCIAAAELANITERRIERLVNSQLSGGLPAFLTERGGLHSGFMIAQYTAAALVSENKVLAHPASVDSIPTSANQEDHVSMGTIASRKFRNIVDNLSQVVAIEFLAASQAADLICRRQGLKSAPVLEWARNSLRQRVPYLDEDRIIADDIATARSLILEPDFFNELLSLLRQ